MGRATTLRGLQVFGYKDRCVMQHDPKVTTFYLSPSQPFLPNMSCYRSAIVDEHVRPACDDLDTDNYNDEDENNEDHDDTYVKYNDIQQSPIDEYDIDMTDVLDSAQYKCASTAIHEQTNATVRELVEDTGQHHRLPQPAVL